MARSLCGKAMKYYPFSVVGAQGMNTGVRVHMSQYEMSSLGGPPPCVIATAGHNCQEEGWGRGNIVDVGKAWITQILGE